MHWVYGRRSRPRRTEALCPPLAPTFLLPAPHTDCSVSSVCSCRCWTVLSGFSSKEEFFNDIIYIIFYKWYWDLVMLYFNQLLFLKKKNKSSSCLSKIEEDQPPLPLWTSLLWLRSIWQLPSPSVGSLDSVSLLCTHMHAQIVLEYK